MRSVILSLVLGLVGSALVACGGSDGSEEANGAPVEPGAGSSSGGGTSSGTTSGGTSTSGGTTPPPPPPANKTVRFVAMGDTGEGNDGQQKVANAVAAKCKKDGCDFVQLLGDNLYDSGASGVDDPLWQSRFEVPYAAIELPFYAVLGNHDYGHGGLGTDFGKGKNEVDYTQKSKKWKMPSAYYHFTKENVEIVALDTNMMMFGQDDQQKTDVQAWLASSKSEWKIAMGHHPYKSNGKHGNAGSYDKIPFGPPAGGGVKSFLENNVCGKADVYLAGHDHSRQWLNESCKGTELAVSGAGAKATELTQKNPSLFQSLALGFLYVVIDGKTLTAQFVDENGVVEFTHTTKKP